MKNQNFLKGLFIILISLIFLVLSFNYRIGTFGQSGPGLFPLLISFILFLIGIFICIKSKFIPVKILNFNFKNISIITISIIIFVCLSQFVNMILGLAAMVFIAALANDDFSFVRTIKIIAVLSVIAFGMLKGLGFQLPLY